MSVSLMRISEFDRWVADNNIPDKYAFGKGWWDYVEMVRRIAGKFDVAEVRVVGHYFIDTPPPCERLPMPAVALEARGVQVAMKWDFGKMRCWPFEWTLSVRRRSPYRGPTFGLFDTTLDLRREKVAGLAPDFVFGPYRDDPAEFSCEVEDEWDVAAVLKLLFYEA